MARPKGSKNKRSVGIPADLAEKMGYTDPADVLGEYMTMPHKQLQKMMRSAAGARAVLARLDAAKAAMPYVHSKMPVKVEVPPERLPTLKILTNTNTIENQELIKKITEAVRRDMIRQFAQDIETKGETNG